MVECYYYFSRVKKVKAKTNVTRYYDKSFKKKERIFLKEPVFDVTSVDGYGKTTRLRVSNGKYITSNMDYVQKLKYPKSHSI
ncbi:DUF5776 domain-containing protein [Lactiplantibacillus plantarum]|uniref:DUF5776 domain-containing protein n=1 Tax=Lactiplantibacillus plantarum TaxID=1590 RepID=UPI001C9E9BB7